MFGMQTARHLVKSCEAVAKGRQVEGSAAYLMHAEQELQHKCSVQSAEDWEHPEVLEAALRCAHNLLQEIWRCGSECCGRFAQICMPGSAASTLG